MLTNSSWTNGRRTFRLWRHSRPFWGGLLLIVAGIELFASANMDLTAIQFHLGPEGFLSYLLPVLLLVCGLLVWLTPQQRAFYAIIGTLTAIYALIGLNLGGFLLGTVIGMVGGGLSFAWAPTVTPTAPAGEPGEALQAAEAGSDEGDATGGRHQSDERREPYGRSGAVTDRRLNESTTPTLGARRRSNLAVSVGVPILLAAALVAAVTAAPVRAMAAPTPCPTNPATPAAGQTGAAAGAANPPAAGPSAAAPPAAAPAATTTTASTPTPTSTDGPAMTRPPTAAEIWWSIQHNIIDAWVEFWAKVFGIPLPPTPTPTSATVAAATTPTTTQPAPQAAPTTDPTTPATGGPAPTGAPAPTPTTASTGCPTTSGSAAGPSATPAAAPKAAALAAGQPTAAETPATLTATTQILAGFSFDGVATLPTASGSIQALQFSATRATSVDFALQSASGGQHSLSINSNPLVVSGAVTLFATEFHGTTTLRGITVTLTFTPANPPLVTLPDMTFTDVTIQLAFLDTTTLQAPTLAQTSN